MYVMLLVYIRMNMSAFILILLFSIDCDFSNE